MPNIAVALRNEIARIAKRELKAELLALRKAASTHRSNIAALKRKITALERAIRVARRARPSQSREPAIGTKLRFSATRLAAHRAKLGLSAADYARLVGASALSVYKWERGARPRQKHLESLAAVRGLSRAQALRELAK